MYIRPNVHTYRSTHIFINQERGCFYGSLDLRAFQLIFGKPTMQSGLVYSGQGEDLA